MSNNEGNIMFNDFLNFWHFAKFLTKRQQKIIFNNLSCQERKNIQKTYKDGGWEDVFVRNNIDEIIDEIKNKYNYDILEIRTKVLSGKSVYLPKKFWDEITNKLSSFKAKHTSYVLGKLETEECSVNKNVILIKIK